ncbi:unnamed protein product [Rhizoctonia solani]|uniref:Uncharacterized protein n=1 Tax=Rhizoctonia solani TaxID=456999 RepID=A0A8H2ZWD0_9AGAM|nr:unnamed protein product [Rhizoctonia solani]
MVQILPQFATLLAFTVIAARSAPHTNSHHDRRFVLDARIPGLLHSRVTRGDSSDEQAGDKVPASDSSVEPVYVISSQMSPLKTLWDNEDDHVQPAPIRNPSRLSRRRRSLDDPIDEPDHEQDERFNAKGEQESQDDEDDKENPLPDEQEEESSLGKRQYYIDGVNAPGLVVSHVNPSLLSFLEREVALYDIRRRGLLDPLIPILGSLPGVGGVISIISDTLGNVLNGLPIIGPLLGGLLLSPHKSASAQGVDGAPASLNYFLDAASIRNASTIYLVDSGRPSPFALASQEAGSNSTIGEQLVSLQMAFVNPETGKIEAHCATFKGSDGDQSEPAALAVQPCITDGMSQEPHPSQLWGFNPSNAVVRPMWNVQKSEGSNSKRAYVVQSAGGQNATVSESVGNGMDKVVLVFKPWETNNTNATQPGAMYDPKEAGNWQLELGNGTAGDIGPAGAQSMIEDYDEGVPVFIAGAVSA